MRNRGFTLIQLLVTVSIIGILGTLGVPSYRVYVERARVTRAIGQLGEIAIAIKEFEAQNNGALPDSLADVGFDGLADPWGNPYQYVNIESGGAPRTDHLAAAVNSDYDLFSMGADGAFGLPLTDDKSKDDVLRGTDGGFLGIVTDYSRLP